MTMITYELGYLNVACNNVLRCEGGGGGLVGRSIMDIR